MSPIRRIAGTTFSSLHTPNLRLYFAGLTISQIGSWLQMVAVPWLVLHLTHSGTALGLTYALQFVPILLLGAWAGVISDRYDKRRMLLVTTTWLGIVALILGVITLLGVVQLWIIAVRAILMGVGAAFDSPPRRAIVAEIVGPDELVNAVSLNNAVFTVSRIIGPALAGILIATVGIGWCFVLNAVSFGAVMLALVWLKTDEMYAARRVPREKGQLRAGIRYAWNEPLVRLALAMTIVVGVFSFNYQVILPLLAKRTFAGGPGVFALMFAATGVGALIGALTSAHQARITGRLLAGSSLALGATMAVATFAPTLALEYVALVPLGLTGMAFFSFASAAIQERSDSEVRGRVSALFAVAFIGTTPLGSPIIGAVCQQFGPRAGLALGAVAALAAGGVAWLWLRRREAVEAHPGATIGGNPVMTAGSAPAAPSI